MEFVKIGPLQSLWATALLLAAYLACGKAGRSALMWLGLRGPAIHPGERRLFSVGAGLMLLSLTVLALGTLGRLTVHSVVAVLILLGMLPFLIPQLRNNFTSPCFSQAPPPLSRADTLIFGVMGAACLLAWIQALAPPTGNDALAYHLAHPKVFVQAHRISYLAFTRESLWPYQTEMLFTAGLLLQGTTLAQLFHWSFYPLTAAAAYSLAHRFYGARAAKASALTFLFTPVAFAQAGQAYVDLSLTFFVLLALYAFLLKDDLGDVKSAVLSGLFCGGALATKYLGLNAAFVFFAMWIFSRKNIKAALIFAGTVIVAGGIWYWRSWAVLGNPVYPFFSQVFGHGLETDVSRNVGKGIGVMDFLWLGWNMTVHPASVGGERIGAFFLLFLPCLLLTAGRPRRQSLEIALFAFLSSLLIFKQSPHARFFLTIIPLFSVGVGVALARLMGAGRRIRLLAVGTFAAILLVQGGYFIYRLRNVWPAALGREPAASYLGRLERSFEGHRYFKEEARRAGKIFNAAEPRIFYDETGRMTADTAQLRKSVGGSSASLWAFLDREGFDYLWLRKPSDLEGYARSRGYEPAHSYRFREGPAEYQFLIYSKAGDGAR